MSEEKSKHEHSLEEVYKLVKENNKILKAMRRDAFVGSIVKFVFWILIFFVLPYIFYTMYLAPYLEQIQSAYQNINQSAQTVNSAAVDINALKAQFPGVDVESLLKQFGIGN